VNDRCPTCKRQIKRSNAANSRYWLVLNLASEKVKPNGVQYPPETWHHYYKLKFLGGNDVTLPSGKVIVVPKSSAELPKDEFHQYVTMVEHDVNENGAYLDEQPA
jgi:hypothetical protein